jgi:hypothetical protein
MTSLLRALAGHGTTAFDAHLDLCRQDPRARRATFSKRAKTRVFARAKTWGKNLQILTTFTHVGIGIVRTRLCFPPRSTMHIRHPAAAREPS